MVFNRNLAVPTSYKEADSALSGNDEIAVDYNTILSRSGPQSIALVLYDTVIVFYHADNSLALHTDGHHTKTTKARINAALGSRGSVHAVNGKWWFCYPTVYGDSKPYDRARVPFEEGMVID